MKLATVPELEVTIGSYPVAHSIATAFCSYLVANAAAAALLVCCAANLTFRRVVCFSHSS